MKIKQNEKQIVKRNLSIKEFNKNWAKQKINCCLIKTWQNNKKKSYYLIKTWQKTKT